MQCTYFSFCEKLSIHNEHGFYAASIPSETQADGRGSPVVCLMDGLPLASDFGLDAVGLAEALRHPVRFVFALVKVAHLNNSPIHFAIETTTKALGHVSEVHVLIVYFTKIRVSPEIFICGEGCTEFQCLGSSHVAFDTLAAGSARENTHSEFNSLLVQPDGSFR